jgi:hypothetical protein
VGVVVPGTAAHDESFNGQGELSGTTRGSMTSLTLATGKTIIYQYFV